ncbi:helix-turn-helix domain-containing protein [Microbacterium lacticum]|uniref:helix-turn-helix domain-containing protein n=1 Tax=Microbacterium lacticum TaxID=33885 RepID=UPI0018B0240C|nr:helix-turn-helix domain-containing protein [Microbacterium lacticum]MBF9335407.1 helix-turn-helix domain-containing protein [Microbacterium lacticum]
MSDDTTARYLPVSKAAALLGVHRTTLARAVREGSFPSRQIGKRRMVAERDVIGGAK